MKGVSRGDKCVSCVCQECKVVTSVSSATLECQVCVKYIKCVTNVCQICVKRGSTVSGV